MDYALRAVGHVQAMRTEADDDDWGGSVSCIALAPDFGPAALQGLADFSHVEILYLFDRVDPDRIVRGARHPRNNPAWPEVGIFAQRGKNRPNRIGSTVCRLVRIEDTRLWVAELDAIDGTPVLDIKPVMTEFLPRGALRQPAWCAELMEGYWRTPTSS